MNEYKANVISVFHDDTLADKSLHNTKMQLAAAFGRWNDVYASGAMSPSYEDGFVLNMIRNEILACQVWMKRIVCSRCWPEPDLIHKELPPPVAPNYMVRGNEYRSAAFRLWRQIAYSSAYTAYKEKNFNLSCSGSEKLLPYTITIQRIQRALRQDQPMQFQRALLDGLLDQEIKIPMNAGYFLAKLQVVVDELGDEDFNAQQTLYV